MKPKTEHLPELQRRASELNAAIRQLAEDAWINGFRVRVTTEADSIAVTPEGCKRKQTVNIEKRRR